jgi:short subunit fatty acids transporter
MRQLEVQENKAFILVLLLAAQGVNYLNAFSKGFGGSAGVLTQFPPLKNIKITGLYAHRKNPNPNIDIILQKVKSQFSILRRFTHTHSRARHNN